MNNTNAQNINGAAPQAPLSGSSTTPVFTKMEPKPAEAAAAPATKPLDPAITTAAVVQHPAAAGVVIGKKPS